MNIKDVLEQRISDALEIAMIPDANVSVPEGVHTLYVRLADANGVYDLFKENGVSVQAAPLQHTIPCVGYVAKEDDRAGANIVPAKIQ